MSCYLCNILRVAKDKKELSHCRITGQINCFNDNYYCQLMTIINVMAETIMLSLVSEQTSVTDYRKSVRFSS